MSASASPTSPASVPSASGLGVNLVTLAGVGLVGYGVMFLIRNFTGFIELGLTPEHVGGTPEQIRAFSPHLYNYISHLQVAVAAFLIAIGVAVIALAWFGIRTGQRWALGAAFLVPLIGVGLALPLHYVYGLATMGHLGPIYLAVAIWLVGVVLARRALAS
jgi:hypothetical protein